VPKADLRLAEISDQERLIKLRSTVGGGVETVEYSFVLDDEGEENVTGKDDHLALFVVIIVPKGPVEKASESQNRDIRTNKVVWSFIRNFM